MSDLRNRVARAIFERRDNPYLRAGSHKEGEKQFCLLEAVAYIAGEPHSDHPKCVSPVLGAFGRALNDALPEDRRQELRPLIEPLVGTAGNPEVDQRRGLMAMDWLVRTYLPAFLRLVPELVRHAEQVSALPELTSWDDVERVTREVLTPARTDAAAARVAACDAACPAVWDAARAALRPTVAELQASAIALFRRMIAVGRDAHRFTEPKGNTK